MGAYENPKFFSVDYTAGTKAFDQAFQRGLAQGEKIFQERQEARDEYKEGVYEEGAKLEAHLETLVGNAKMTAETMQGTLNEFYEFAFEKGERQKGLKGLFTPREENRIEGVQMKNYTNSFKSEYAAIKALSVVAGDVETIPSEDLDLGGEGQEKQLYYKSLQQEGRLKTNFKLVKGKGFESSFEVLDAKGNPTGEVISSNEMNLAMNTDTRAARTEINNAWDKAYTQKEGDGSITAEVNNILNQKFTKASYDDDEEYFEAEGQIKTAIDRTNGLEGYLDDNGDLKIKNEDGTYDFSKIPDITGVNNFYNNIVKASPGEKLAAFKTAFGDDHGLSDDQIDRIMDKAMKVGVGGLKNDRIVGLDGPLKINEDKYDKIYGASLVAKHKLTRNYQIQSIKNNGVLDKFNKPKEQQETGGLSEFQKKGIYDENRYYNVQKNDLNRSLNNLTNVIDLGFEVDNMKVNQGAEELKGIFKNKKYEFDGGEKTSITDVNVDYDGNITIYAGDPKSYKVTLKKGDPGYNPDVPIANVKFLADTDAKKVTFSAYSPSDYKKLLINFGAEAKDPRNYEVKANDEIIIRAKELADKGKFKDARYRQWFNELNRTKSGKKWLQEWAQKNEANATGPLWNEITGKNTPANTGGAYDDLN
jgi:hypothetical protein